MTKIHAAINDGCLYNAEPLCNQPGDRERLIKPFVYFDKNVTCRKCLKIMQKIGRRTKVS